MFPVGLLLFANEYLLHHVELDPAILSTVSAMVGMIPEGLILLASTVMAVAVVRLARHQVLVQQLYCIETLARVDVLCLDKTGTITTGGMEVSKLVPLDTPDSEAIGQELNKVVASLVASDEDPNDTARAIQEYFGLASDGKQKTEQGITPTDLLKPTRVIPFSSDTKWSGAAFANGEAYVIGSGTIRSREECKRFSAESKTRSIPLLLLMRACCSWRVWRVLMPMARSKVM